MGNSTKKLKTTEKWISDDQFEYLKKLNEQDDFWTVSRNDILLKHVKESPVLDVGCGAGVLTKRLIKNGFKTYSLDINQIACDYTKKHYNPRAVIHCNFIKFNKKIPVKTIILADVLEHIEDDIKALCIARKLLNKGGRLILSVPYSNYLWSKNDERWGHKRRYSVKELKEKLYSAGFDNIKISYWNFLTVLPKFFFKILNKETPHELFVQNKFLNLMLTTYFKIENAMPVPIGLSLIAIADVEFK